MELEVVTPDAKMKEQMASAGRLVGQSIRDLRLMTRNFHPDADLLLDGGWKESLKNVFSILYKANAPLLIVKDRPNKIGPELKLIVFDVLLKLLISLEEEKKTCTRLTITFIKTALKIDLDFTGIDEHAEQDHIKTSVTNICRNILLLHGKLTVLQTTNDMYRLKLIIPVK